MPAVSYVAKWRFYSDLFIARVLETLADSKDTGDCAKVASLIEGALGQLYPLHREAALVLLEAAKAGVSIGGLNELIDELGMRTKIPDHELQDFKQSVIEAAGDLLIRDPWQVVRQLSKAKVRAEMQTVLEDAIVGKVSMQEAVDRVMELASQLSTETGVLRDVSAADLIEEYQQGSLRPELLVSRPFRLPKGVVGILASLGGIGKSMVMLLMSLSVATAGGKVLYISLEDPAWAIASRLSRLLESVRLDEYSPVERPEELEGSEKVECIRDRLKVAVMEEFMPVVDSGGVTDFGDRFFNSLRRKVLEGEYDLVVIDPIAGLIAEENNNTQASLFMRRLNGIVRDSGYTCSIMLVHHISKDSSKLVNATADAFLSTASVRGASGLAYASKFVVELVRFSQLSREYATELAGELAEFLRVSPEILAGESVERRREILVLHNTKNNYFPVFRPVLITLGAGGLTNEVGVAVFDAT